MYDGKQYQTYEFSDEGTVLECTWEKDYFDPDFTCFISSRTLTLEEAVRLLVSSDDGGYLLYRCYFEYMKKYGEEAASRFRSLVRLAGGQIDLSIADLSDFIKNHWRR